MLSLLTGATPPINIPPSLIPTPPAIVRPAEPKKIKIVKNDTLTKIAKEENTTVERLFDKNTQLQNPDLLKVGDEIIIPEASEKLESRIPPVAVKNAPQPTRNAPGNAYTPGQCTWYVKNKRPDIPNNWGNASSWLYNAQSQGYSTGGNPRVGAIGWTSGHVVYIEAVNNDGTVTYSDMNGRWIAFEIGGGTVPAGKYQYIY